MRVNPRQKLIEEMRAHLERDSFPRLTILWILFVAGCVAFLTSAFALWLGLTSMAARYALAVLSGYGGFLLTMRSWLEYRQGMWEPSEIWERTSDLTPNPLRSWSTNAPSDSPSFSLDLDDLWWLILLIVAVLGALATIAYVVYDAPQLLAEVALDAGLVSAVYHRLRHEPEQHWTLTAFRKTWFPAALLTLFVSTAGYAMEHLVPHARSIGDVLRAVL
jgi:hypothetical protein